MKLTPQLAEFIGLHTGDGTLYKTNTGIVWELRGDLKEKKYYQNYIVPLIKGIFKIDIKSKFRSGGKNGVWGVQTCNKSIINTLIEFGFKPGTKTYSVKVPNYIFSSNTKSKRAFVRGLFDTDGCLNFMKANSNKAKNYPRIIFSFASRDLRDSLKVLLKNIEFESYDWDYKKKYNLCLSGKEKLLKWEKDIKPNNPKFFKKINNWKSRINICAGIA